MALEWLLTHAEELGIDPRRVVVGGESTGGGLAAAVVDPCRRDRPAGRARPSRHGRIVAGQGGGDARGSAGRHALRGCHPREMPAGRLNPPSPRGGRC
ncbi:alpha/beta hydrolase fold domain-containing protein [Streptomyces sasae]|uniref:alpha/beta hydrolase fold domain-containing protein n=1 Tax=Streptomyces sasae TaxID=1266772 RepID=UPI003744B10B